MKIAIFTDTYTPDINGVVTSVVNLEKALTTLGHEVYIVCPHKGFVKAKKEGNVFRIPGIELKKLYGYVLSKPYDSTIKKEIEELGLDVIHVQQEFSVGIFGRMLGRSLGIPVVYTYHTMYEDYTHYINILNLDSLENASKKVFEQFSKFMCESAQSIIAPSIKTKEKLIEYRVKRPISVIPTGLDLRKFKPENVNQELLQKVRKQLGYKLDDKIIGYVGRIAAEKSLDIVIEGFKQVKNTDVKFLVVGGGPSLDDIKKLADSSKITFTGNVSSDEVPIYYAIMDGFVSASKSETQGLTFIESLAAGLPVFARHDEAVDNLIFEDKTGYYFEDSKELGEKIDAYLAKSKQEVKTINEACIEVVKNYDLLKFGKNVLQVYEDAIENYEESFTITQIKTSDNCMRLYLENDKRNLEETLLVSLDDYMLYDLKKGSLLEFVTFESLKEKEKIILTYRMCLRKLRVKDRTRKEMYDFMINEEEPLDIKYINDIIGDLEDKGYINDELYTMNSCERLDNSLFGKKKIIQKLEEKGIPRESIVKYLSGIDSEHEIEKAKKKAIKYYDTIKNKSVKDKKMSINRKLHNDGFANEICNEVIDGLNFEDDILKEAIVLEKVIDKAIKNYSRKYTGKDLRDRITKYALRKGFMYDDIKHAIEMRDIDET